MISNMESQLKAAGRRRPAARSAGRSPARAQGRRLSAAGDAVEPDRRHAGGLQRADGPLQGADRRVRRPDARLLRQPRWARRTPRSWRRHAEHAKKQVIDIRPADLLKPEWEQLRAEALALEGCNGSDEDVLTYAMFPQVAPKFFKTRARRAEEPGQGSGVRPKLRRKPAPTPAAMTGRYQSAVTLRGDRQRTGAQGYGCAGCQRYGRTTVRWMPTSAEQSMAEQGSRRSICRSCARSARRSSWAAAQNEHRQAARRRAS